MIFPRAIALPATASQLVSVLKTLLDIHLNDLLAQDVIMRWQILDVVKPSNNAPATVEISVQPNMKGRFEPDWIPLSWKFSSKDPNYIVERVKKLTKHIVLYGGRYRIVRVT
jgi:hypothetical protein